MGFGSELIHTFNKSWDKAVGHTSRRASIAHPQKNVLLIGDSRGDVTMADGYVRMSVCLHRPEHRCFRYPSQCVLRIGFLNIPGDQNLEDYKVRLQCCC